MKDTIFPIDHVQDDLKFVRFSYGRTYKTQWWFCGTIEC